MAREYQILKPYDPRETAWQVIALSNEGWKDAEIFEQLAEELLDYFINELHYYPDRAVRETDDFISKVSDSMFSLIHEWPDPLTIDEAMKRAARRFGREVFEEMYWRIYDTRGDYYGGL
ncbi:MAG: hypothetical protein QXT16_04685 [Candidatus Caldarchaeum sp.]